MKILIAGYPYIRENFLKTFLPGMKADEIFVLLPKIWKAKMGKVKFSPPLKDGVVTTSAFFYHSHYPIIGGLLKGWMPMLPLFLWKLRNRIDILYSPSEPILLTTLYQGVWARLFGKQHIIFTWENVPYSKKFYGINLFARDLLIRLNCFFADGIVCGNQGAQDIIRSYAHKPTTVIPLSGVDEEFFKKPGLISKSFAGHDLKDKIVYAFVGAIGYRKGIHLIVEALGQVVRDYPQAIVVIAGSGEYEPEIDALLDRYSVREHVIQVSWLHHEQLRELLSIVDVFLYPSIPYSGWEEQFGYSIAEAALMELPIISTKSGSISELVQDGTTGILVEPNNKGQLAQAMSRLAGDPELRLRLGKAARKHVVDRFSYQTVYKKFQDFFRLIDGKSQ